MPRSATTKPKRPSTSAGDGWGGPARGTGTGGPIRSLTPEQSRIVSALRFTPEAKARRAVRAEAAAELEAHLMTLSFTAEREETQVSASARLHAICDGMPVQSMQHGSDGTLQLGVVMIPAKAKP